MVDNDLSVFEERGENLSEAELLSWTVLSNVERQIVKKLTGPGAKLISGPRGSGKSTLLKFAFFDLLKARSALPVYVNFSKALALEPLYHTNANAAKIFRQWVLAKILVGLNEIRIKWLIQVTAADDEKLRSAHAFIIALESGAIGEAALDLAPSEVSATVAEVARLAGVTRTVLLLDDAAHAFSVQQQREFFEVFRELRSREIAAKAAIYPGVTSFSPSFQVGHEAEEIQAWIRADDEGYLPSMRELAEKRFPTLRERLAGSYDEAIDVIALASFGLPRGFINMASEVIDSIELGSSVRKSVMDAVSSNSEAGVTQFTNIADKLPRFANYVKVGVELEEATRMAFREFNRGKALGRKTATIALAEPWNAELDRVLRFMEYAGLLRRTEGLSKGVKGNYQRYVLHYSRVIAGNALSLGKAYRLASITDALKQPSAHALVKAKPESLLGKGYSERCALALPPCPSCGTARLSEQQKFCMNCGKELRAASVYLELLKAPVSRLPLPSRKVAALQEVGLQSIGQLLSDEKHRFRKPGSSIGPIWTKRILNVAEEFVSV